MEIFARTSWLAKFANITMNTVAEECTILWIWFWWDGGLSFFYYHTFFSKLHLHLFNCSKNKWTLMSLQWQHFLTIPIAICLAKESRSIGLKLSLQGVRGARPVLNWSNIWKPRNDLFYRLKSITAQTLIYQGLVKSQISIRWVYARSVIANIGIHTTGPFLTKLCINGNLL